MAKSIFSKTFAAIHKRNVEAAKKGAKTKGVIVPSTTTGSKKKKKKS
jgi:hypothetical protein